MKSFIIYLLIKTLVSLDRKVVIEYARKWCNNYNPVYIKYTDEGEAGNFASQCLYEGGESFSGCTGKDWWGMVYSYNNLMACLKAKGWEQSEERNSSFLPGYPLIVKDARGIMIAKGFEGNQTFYYRHQEKNECTGHRHDSKLIFLYKK